MEIMESVSLRCKQIDVPAHVHFGFLVIVIYFMDEEQRIGNDNCGSKGECYVEKSDLQ